LRAKHSEQIKKTFSLPITYLYPNSQRVNLKAGLLISQSSFSLEKQIIDEKGRLNQERCF
jgi:hypothetical protein